MSASCMIRKSCRWSGSGRFEICWLKIMSPTPVMTMSPGSSRRSFVTRASQFTFSAGCGGWMRRLYTELLWSNVSVGGAWV